MSHTSHCLSAMFILTAVLRSKEYRCGSGELRQLNSSRFKSQQFACVGVCTLSWVCCSGNRCLPYNLKKDCDWRGLTLAVSARSSGHSIRGWICHRLIVSISHSKSLSVAFKSSGRRKDGRKKGREWEWKQWQGLEDKLENENKRWRQVRRCEQENKRREQ